MAFTPTIEDLQASKGVVGENDSTPYGTGGSPLDQLGARKTYGTGSSTPPPPPGRKPPVPTEQGIGASGIPLTNIPPISMSEIMAKR